MKKCWNKLVDNKKDKIFVYKNTCKKDPRYHLEVYQQTYHGKKQKDWFVDLDTTSVGMTLKIVKSKDNALKFAKNYMRKH